MTSDYLISCFYYIIQFRLKKNIRTEIEYFRQQVREKEKEKNQADTGGGGGGGGLLFVLLS